MKIATTPTMTGAEIMQTCKVLNEQASIEMARLIRRMKRGQFISTAQVERFWAATMPQWYQGAQDSRRENK